MSIISCLARMQARGEISEKQRQEAESIYKGLYDRLYPTMPTASAEARAAIETAEILEQRAQAQRQSLVRDKVATAEAWDRIQNHPNGPMAGMNALLGHDIHGHGGINVESLGAAYETRAANMLNQLLDKYGTKLGGLKQDIAGVKNAIREMRGVDTGDKRAKGVASGWNDLFGPDGVFVKEMKALDPTFNAAEDWGTPQFWETYRARQFKANVFKQDLRQETATGGFKPHDPDTGLEANPIRREEILAGAVDKIIKDLPFEGGVGAAFTHDMRVFRFSQDKAGADSFIRLMDKYGAGQGGYVGMLQGHVQRASRALALAKIFGPNYRVNIEGLYNKALALNRTGKWDDVATPSWGEKIQALMLSPLESENATRRLIDHMTGKGTQIGSQSVSDFFNGYRGFTAARKMGSGFITGLFQDPTNMLAEASWLGMNQSRMMGDLVRGVLGGGWSEGELTRMGILLRSAIDQGIGVKRFEDQWLGARLGQRLGDFVVRASRLAHWDEVLRTTFQKEFLASFGDRAGKAFDQLDKPFKDHLLTPYRISEDEWKTLSDPANHFKLGSARILDLDKLLGPNEGLRQKLLSAMFDERSYGYIVSGTPQARAFVKRGQPGTLFGEVARNAFQFKTWPVTYMATWGTRMMAQPSLATALPIAARLVLFGTTAGAMTLGVKSLLNGKDWPEMRDPWFWVESAVQGSVAGLASDYVRDFFSRDSTTLIESLMGPIASDIRDISEVLSKTARAGLGEHENWGSALAHTIRDATPGSTLWYTRLITQRLIFDEFQKMLDPNWYRSFLRQRDRNIKTRNQDFYWPPGQPGPERTPQFMQ
jgi:hypothetical protein